jgi:hypothetical protein
VSTEQTDNRKYDVAFSFLNEDLALAQTLTDGLSAQLQVFVYANRQEEIAGTDGLETFRTVFRHEARLVVVLFRPGWGETRWTRVEQQAITDRFLNEGPAFLFFVMVNAADPPPPWVPEQKIRFNLADFGIQQAIGAIKLRVQDIGGKLTKESIAERARKSHELSRFNRETEQMMGSEEGVRLARESALLLVSELERFAAEAKAAAPGLNLEFAKQDTSIVVRTPSTSLSVAWCCMYINTLDRSYLFAGLFRGSLILPGEDKYYIEQPKPTAEYRFLSERLRGIGWCWKLEQVTRSSAELAEHLLGLLLDEVQRQNIKSRS